MSAYRDALRGAFCAVAVAVAALLLFAPMASAQSSGVVDSRETIERQLDAFQRDAWDEAYAFAAPGVKLSFPTVDRFSQMVREGYPMVWRPSSVEFLDAEIVGDRIAHRLELIGPDGAAYIATYVMTRSETGWLVAAVRIERAEDEPTA